MRWRSLVQCTRGEAEVQVPGTAGANEEALLCRDRGQRTRGQVRLYARCASEPHHLLLTTILPNNLVCINNM